MQASDLKSLQLSLVQAMRRRRPPLIVEAFVAAVAEDGWPSCDDDASL